MHRTICILACLIGACAASSYGYYKPKKRCYQCEYSPPKTIAKTIYKIETTEIKVPVTSVHCWYTFELEGRAEDVEGNPEAVCTKHMPTCETTTTYKIEKMTKEVPETVTEMIPAGGFDACKGPIDYRLAHTMGVDSWDCDSNCYIRKDAFGLITRGCYAGENEVDPELLGCNEQAGQTYCFCDDDRCNGDVDGPPQQDWNSTR